MSKQQRTIDRYGTRREVETYKATLGDFFPADDKMSPWLMRLAIIRDDLRFEIDGLALSEDATNRDTWRCGYFLRKITITLLEAERILNYDLTTALKRRSEDFDPLVANAFRKQAKTVGEHRAALEAVRDYLGAHVRPRPVPHLEGRTESDTPPENVPVEPLVLRKLTAWPAKVVLHTETGRNTDLHELSSTALFFAWPHVDSSIESLAEAHDVYQRVLFACIPAVLHTIDGVLWVFWRNRGLRPVE
jgi:hypothetical protein